MPQIMLSGTSGAGKYAQVDEQDYPRLVKHSWYYKDGYALAKINNKETRMHRLVLNVTDPLEIVDHVNRNRLDNRRKNLRIYNPQQNANNRETNVFISCFGETKTIAEWARDSRCTVSYNVLRKRFSDGIEFWAAILAPNQI
jgi:hypothetical protein